MKSRRYVLLLHGWYWNQLPLAQVVLVGPDRRDFCVHRAEAPSDWLHFDFEPDVRELICQAIQYDKVAMWSDPLEQLGLVAGSRR
jgi:hypothetical protein